MQANLLAKRIWRENYEKNLKESIKSKVDELQEEILLELLEFQKVILERLSFVS